MRCLPQALEEDQKAASERAAGAAAASARKDADAALAAKEAELAELREVRPPPPAGGTHRAGAHACRPARHAAGADMHVKLLQPPRCAAVAASAAERSELRAPLRRVGDIMCRVCMSGLRRDGGRQLHAGGSTKRIRRAWSRGPTGGQGRLMQG